MSKADIGLIGLAVMGQNLVLNMEDHGFTVAVYNRTVSRVDEFINGEELRRYCRYASRFTHRHAICELALLEMW